MICTLFKYVRVALVTVGCAAMVHAKAATPMLADIVMTGGEVYTPNGWAHAVAIRHGTIIAVGSDASMAAYRG